MVRHIGGSAPDVVVVGCQPERIDDGIGLSPAVEAAVGEAAAVVLELISEQEPARVPRNSRTDRRTRS
jgi:hydrogenase maturation protease